MTPGPLLAVEGLSVSIGGAQIIRQLSFRVDAGEIVGLAGASGSGKSMTALAPSLALYPGCAVLLFVLGLNLLGDGLKSRRNR